MPEFLTDAEFTPKTREYPTGPRGPRPRAESQLPWDKAFKSAMDGSGFLHAQLTPDEADEARKSVASAARLHERATTEGEARPGSEPGTVVLSWQIRVPAKRSPKTPESA